MACCRWRHDQSPFGGEAVGPNPTDRAKGGTKRSILVDGNGSPVSVVVDGANRHDKKLLEATIEQLQAPQPDDEEIHLCLDKGYDYPDMYQLVEMLGWISHIHARGEEATARQNLPGYRARRWVVERTHSWMNRFRRLLIRWEKKVDNYLAMIHIACAYICLHQLGVFG